MNVLAGFNQKLFGAVVVKYLEICEMCGSNVDIYYVYGCRQRQVCFFFFHTCCYKLSYDKFHDCHASSTRV